MGSQSKKDNPIPVPQQHDLFGVVEKKQRLIDEVVAKNKADNAAGIKPILQPLFAIDETDE